MIDKSRAMQESEGTNTPENIIQDIAIFYAIFIFSFRWLATRLYILIGPLMSKFLSGIGGSDEFIIGDITTNFVFLTLIIIPILYCLFVENRSITSMGFYGSFIKSLLLGIVVGFVLMVIILLIQVLFGVASIKYAGTLPIHFMIIVFLSYFIQSSGEEILCRGYFMNSLGAKYPWFIAVIVNSVVFGLLHISNSGATPIAIINTMLAGICFSVVAVRFNLWVSCMFHTIWNFSQWYVFANTNNGTIATIFHVTYGNGSALLNGGEYGIEGSVITTIIYVIAIVLILLLPQSSRNNGTIF